MSTVVPGSGTPSPTPMVWGISLWVAQVLLAAAFGIGGILKTTQPIPDLAEMLVWPGALPAALVRFIGASQLAAAIGLILPAATRIKPILTPLAATGLIVIMALAAVFHLWRGEAEALPINVMFGALAAFVAWGRFRKAPISPR
ncbi:MAG TPA: DoxX family protein [Thermoanaerobaculia bacterium]|nr:DoxX family protein [Thermoanaerobaculia bacterium]